MSAVHSYTAAANLSLAFVEKMICSSRRLRLVALRRYCVISCIGFSELPLLGGWGVAEEEEDLDSDSSVVPAETPMDFRFGE